MNFSTFRTLFAISSLAAVAAGIGCVGDRPSRNGVFNENQYIRKDFLVPSGTDSMGNPALDPGWMLKATVTDVSSPNLLGGDLFGIFPGAHTQGEMVRFVITQDKLNMVSMREIEPSQSTGRIPETVNAWPVTNVDLKYRVNLDGEKTNFYEENQELDWQVRQWIKINFAKNDLSDIAPFGVYLNDALGKCADLVDSSATLNTGSFLVDEPNNYFQFTVQVTIPMALADSAGDTTCSDAYGQMGIDALKLGVGDRFNVTFNLMYSFMRANPAPTYQPLVLAEKDPILHKYGPITYKTITWDDSTGLQASNQYVMRFDPTKPIDWYFEKDFPHQWMPYFTSKNLPSDAPPLAPGQSTIEDKTNALLTESGAAARVAFHQANEPITNADGTQTQVTRQFGDVRYNFLRWVSDKDMQGVFAGVTQFVTDPRSGETLSSDVVFNDFPIQDYYTQRIMAYLNSVGAVVADQMGNWQTGGCTAGDVRPIITSQVINTKNANDSLYGKMQQYLHKPIAQFGNLGPTDFIQPQDDDFRKAYFTLVPYIVYGDPDANFYVIREGGAGVFGPAGIWKMAQDEARFHQITGQMDRGLAPFQYSGPNELQNSLAFANDMKALTLNHTAYKYAKTYLHESHGEYMDSPDAFSLESIIDRDAQHCVNGQWETQAQWAQSLINTYWDQVFWHEFGHTLGLEHNFAASVDAPNFPTPTKDSLGVMHYPLYSSSVMEYNSEPDRVFWNGGDWAPYDKGAITWIYANNKANGQSSMASLSGQNDANTPWKDPEGFQSDGKTEKMYIYCSDTQQRYTPLCRPGDMGTTPSEIIANDIANYEWQYAWRNYRVYHKFWDNSAYANYPAGFIHDMKRFLAMWAFDWSSGELATTFHRIGILPPGTDPSEQHYYDQLGLKFTQEASAANQMVAAFHKALINESTGERPIVSVYDPYYGDETQQGIILDKYFATQEWVGLWPVDNYDQNQAGGIYLSSWADYNEPAYFSVAVDAAESMVGGQYDVLPYFVPNAVALFAQDTHDPAFLEGQALRNIIGGWSFTRQDDFEAFFKKIAIANNFDATCSAKNLPDPIAACDYDVTNPAITGADPWQVFTTPDGIQWIWTYIPDRNAWMAARKDRNAATFKIIHNYNDDINVQLDDGTFGAYNFELPVKYTLDSFAAFN